MPFAARWVELGTVVWLLFSYCFRTYCIYSWSFESKQCDIYIIPQINLQLCVFTESEAVAVVKAELGEETGLVEEDLVEVSYMGDELDLETVGDIIAIIEEKVHTVFVYLFI